MALSAAPQSPSQPTPPPFAITGFLPPQTKLAGRYTIVRRIGRGGMGAVYQTSDDRITGKQWAVKEMSDAAIINPLEKRRAVDAFQQEAVMLATLDHTNLPKVTDHFSERGKQYLVMDFIEGETLEERVEREDGQPLPVDDVLDWAVQLCDVLEYLHSREPPVVFRDLKPGNVMVTPEGTVKLIDFGIARLFKPGKAADTAFFGTAGYAPREQYGKGQTDARSDVYALGATLYHLLTGDNPVDHPFDFKDAHDLNDQVPEHVAAALAKALAHAPADRWQSVSEMRRVLTEKPLSKPQPLPEPEPEPEPQATVSAPLQSAAVAKTATVTQPTPMPMASRLNLWRGLGLIVLGVVLSSVWQGLAHALFWDVSFLPFAFIAPLFGILFGPWIGGAIGLVSWSMFFLGIWQAIMGDLDAGILVVPVSGFLLGALPAWLIKDAKKWGLVLVVGALTSFVWAVIIGLWMCIVYDAWYDFLPLAFFALQMALPANVVFLPFFARWLVKGQGRWKAAIGYGAAVNLTWVAINTAWKLADFLEWDFGPRIGADQILEVAGYVLLRALPAVLLVPLIAFWLAGSVRRWGLYWRDSH
jgi:serine/threonine-protein kinase